MRNRYAGYDYRTLDNVDPDEDDRFGAPNSGCHCTGGTTRNCPRSYRPLPPGCVLAPNDVDSIAVIAAHGWGTTCVVLADGTSRMTATATYRAGNSCHNGRLATSGSTYSIVGCPYPTRVLARCSEPAEPEPEPGLEPAPYQNSLTHPTEPRSNVRFPRERHCFEVPPIQK